MTAQLPLFVDCPYGGCEGGSCACLEQDLDPDDFDEGDFDPDDFDEDLDDPYPEGEFMFARRRVRHVETVLISIDHYEPVQGT